MYFGIPLPRRVRSRLSSVVRPDRCPEVTARIEGGSVGEVAWESPRRLRFRAAAGPSPRPLWFYFRVERPAAGMLQCELENADECFGPRHGWAHARPVYRGPREPWRRVPRWGYREAGGRGRFSFAAPASGEWIELAYCYPYTPSDLAAMLQELSDIDGLELETLCRSAAGRAVPHVRVGQAARRSVWVLARQHAGETPASFVAEGLLRSLASGELRGRLAGTEVHVLPMLDVDGAAAGDFGKDRSPVDFNRDWSARPYWPQVAAVLQALAARRESAPASLVLDLHASHHGETSCYFFIPGTAGTPALPAISRRFLEALAAGGPPSVGFSPEDVRAEPAPPRSARECLAEIAAGNVLTLEMSYHLAQSGAYLSEADYRQFGAAIAWALPAAVASWP